MLPKGAMQYKKVDTQSGIENANPHRLIQMLMEGALEKIAVAKGHIGRGNIAEKGRYISWAISIIGGLQTSLNKYNGGEVAENLDALYDYMTTRLFEANINNDTSILDEVSKLMKEVKTGWDGIEAEAKKMYQKKSESLLGS